METKEVPSLRRRDIQHNDTQHNATHPTSLKCDTQHNNTRQQH